MMFHLKKLKYRMANTGPITRTLNPIIWGAMKTRLSRASCLRNDSRGPALVAGVASAVGRIEALLTQGVPKGWLRRGHNARVGTVDSACCRRSPGGCRRLWSAPATDRTNGSG